ncbi:MAG: START domain-containing protein [Myxococcaceae bacterium]
MLFAGPILAVVLFAAPPNPNPWNEVKNDDGIRVLARDVQGSNIREVKAETVIEAPAETVWAVVNDQPHYTEFMPYLVEAEVFPADAGPNSRYEYQLIDPPVVSRRDYTLVATLAANPGEGKYRRSWTAANDKGPRPKDGVVRVSICEGYWQVERLTEKTARVTYWLYTDPGGAIPSWMANKANTTSVPNLIRAVRNRSLDPKWRRD